MARIGIVYASASKILRRITVPDHPSELDAAAGPGETVLEIEVDRVPDLQTCKDLVKSATGVAPPSGRCVLVDGVGHVVSVIMADPDLDSVKNHTLMAHDTAVPGWTWTRNGGLVRPTPP